MQRRFSIDAEFAEMRQRTLLPDHCCILGLGLDSEALASCSLLLTAPLLFSKRQMEAGGVSNTGRKQSHDPPFEECMQGMGEGDNASVFKSWKGFGFDTKQGTTTSDLPRNDGLTVPTEGTKKIDLAGRTLSSLLSSCYRYYLSVPNQGLGNSS